MSVEVLKMDGKKSSSKLDLSKDVFGVEPNDHIIYLDVKQYLANQRQGTHKAKEVSELSGSTRKIKKQKGTGTARAGSIKSPLFVGGARVFGPRPRSYSFKLNKKVKNLARKSVLSYKAKENNVIVLDALSFDAPKTKNFINLIKNLKLETSKSLFIVEGNDTNTYLSARNLKNVSVKSVDSVSTYDIMNANKLVFTQSSLTKLEGILN